MQIPDDIADSAIAFKDQYFDLRGLSAYSSMKVPTLRDHIRKGLPCFKCGGKLLIRMSEFDAWLEKFRINKEQDLETLVEDVMADFRS